LEQEYGNDRSFNANTNTMFENEDEIVINHLNPDINLNLPRGIPRPSTTSFGFRSRSTKGGNLAQENQVQQQPWYKDSLAQKSLKSLIDDNNKLN